MKRAFPYLALIICVACGYLGYFVALRVAYQYDQSTSFSSPEKQEAEQLRKNGRTMLAFSLSNMLIQNTLTSIQSNVSILAKIRREAPQELWPILDLRLAKDYAMMGRLEQLAGNSSSAATHQQAAKDLLRSIGWRDVSENTVTDMADRQLHSRLKQ